MAITFFILSIGRGEKYAIQQEVETEASRIAVQAGHVQKGIFDFPITTDNFLLTQKFLGSDITINNTGIYLYFCLFAFAVIIFLSVIPSLPRLYFMGGMLAFVLFLAQLNTENLHFPGPFKHLLLAILVISYLGASFYFHSFKKEASLKVRLVIFSLLTVLMGFLIQFFCKEISYPFLSLAVHSIPAAVFLSIIFIIIIAPEIVRGFLHLITYSGSGQGVGNDRHFMLITLVYLINVLFIYLKNSGVINWNIFYLNEFLLLMLSAVLGFWGLKERSEKVQGAIPFYPLGAFLFLAVGSVCLATIGYGFFTSNDSIIEAFEDVIVYAHFSLGLMFFIYVLVNFHSLLRKNYAVSKVVFDPRKMPYSLAVFVGVGGIVFFMLRANFLPFYQAMAGYYNGIADWQLKEDKRFLAKQYYKRARIFQVLNHRSNYSLASLSRQEGDQSAALNYFKQAAKKNPTPFDYINISDIYQDRGMFFDALFTLKEGIQKFPGNGALYNNLGLLYAQTNVLDSALIFFQSATNDKKAILEGQTNQLAIWVKSGVDLPVDSLEQRFQNNDHLPLKTNLALLGSLNQFVLNEGRQEDDWKKWEKLNLFTFTNTYNTAFNQRNFKDSLRQTVLGTQIRSSGNKDYQEDLKRLQAFRFYQQHKINQSLELLQPLADQVVGRKSYYNELMGLIALDQDAPLKASEFFKRAGLESEKLQMEYAVALTEAGKKKDALLAWEELLNSSQKEIATLMIQIFESQAKDLEPESDEIKYQAACVWLAQEDWKRFDEIKGNLKQQKFTFKVFERAMEKALATKAINRAKGFMNKINDMSGLSLEEVKQRDRLNLQLFIEENLFEDLASTLPDVVQRADKEDYELHEMINLAKAILAQERKEFKDADELFQQVVKENNFFDLGIRAAANYFDQIRQQEEIAYQMLLSGLKADPYSRRIREAYIMQCLKMGLNSFAESALVDLSDQIPAEQFILFKLSYEAKRKERQQSPW
ncbi:tetratricopeptide repeat protein [Xanthovirga aplysinae]|uniref:tetratricopeptide repeat protein n=1 Tax=Xanthovirga aplysinae TaxID=2529853 RepID=UPI001CA404E1|nr:hypothetical protein [Xanthovirga aplysinae]